ncbi:MAG: hypothetical protein MUE87_00120 [Methanothrix sp.]|jgi:adenine-specific DNA-methyltransferase|nr:hypothetical protein [Methanothrix sp.]
MTAIYDYYDLAHQEEGISSGFRYRTVPYISLKSIANNTEIKDGMSRKEIEKAITKYANQETLYDQPFINNSKVRITGPFTVEAVPSPVVKPLVEVESSQEPDASLARSGETLRQREWRVELFRTGIITTQGQRIKFSRVEPLAGTRYLHAEAETMEDEPKRTVISFGPEHAPLEQRQDRRGGQIWVGENISTSYSSFRLCDFSSYAPSGFLTASISRRRVSCSVEILPLILVSGSASQE